MAVDLRQVMAAFLTFSMFIMLGNMIKRDHIDPLLEPLPMSPNVQYGALKLSKPGMVKLTEISHGPWKEINAPLRQCWQKPSSKGKEQSNGYIFFTLSHGPEFHALQVANAVVVARHLGATLALPDIRGTRLGQKRHFEEIYDVEKFITSLSGVVRVDKNPPAGLSNGRLRVVRVPNGVLPSFISASIEPIFRSKKHLKIVTSFNSSAIPTGKQADKLSNAYQCQAMFQSLKLQAELQELVDSMVGTLRSLSQKTRGRFVAVDLRVEMLGKNCQLRTKKWCYNAEETSEFLKRIGFDKDVTVYVTQTGWHSSLDALRSVFPHTFTKDVIMPSHERAKFMGSVYESLIDFYLCTQGNVFVAAHPSRFYEGVVGKRIACGNTQILIPAKNMPASASVTDYISSYIAKKSHLAYSCFC